MSAWVPMPPKELYDIKDEDNNWSVENILTSSVTVPINRINVGGADYDIQLSRSQKEKLFEEFSTMFSVVPSVEHKCHNCGMSLELKADQHIFKCKYCGSCYAIGTNMINDRG